MIFDWYSAGVHYGVIRKRLFNAGYRNRAGKEFTTASIYEILRNRKYVGDLYLGKTLFRKGKRNTHQTSANVQYFENVIPAIISRDILRRCRLNWIRINEDQEQEKQKLSMLYQVLYIAGSAGLLWLRTRRKTAAV